MKEITLLQPQKIVFGTNCIHNFGILFLVPYTKDFGRITQF